MTRETPNLLKAYFAWAEAEKRACLAAHALRVAQAHGSSEDVSRAASTAAEAEAEAVAAEVTAVVVAQAHGYANG